MNSNYLYQELRFGRGGCNLEEVKRLKVCASELWNEDDIKYFDLIKVNNMSSVQRKFLLSKRALKIVDENNKTSIVVIPHGEIVFSRDLGSLAKRYFALRKIEDEPTRIKYYEAFWNKLYVLRLNIAKRLFSKRFSEKYLFNFHGFSGVALTHSRGLDEILVPEWFGLKIGDLVMVTRDPVQNVVVVLKVVGFTKNEIRVSPDMLDRYLAGDCDGDKIQVIELSSIYNMNSQYFVRTYEEFYEEAMKLIPGENFGFNELLNENI